MEKLCGTVVENISVELRTFANELVLSSRTNEPGDLPLCQKLAKQMITKLITSFTVQFLSLF